MMKRQKEDSERRKKNDERKTIYKIKIVSLEIYNVYKRR